MKKLTILIGLMFLVSSCGMFGHHHHGHHSCPKKKMKHMDTNKDGKVSKEEFSSYKMEKFSKLDKDGDGFLNMAELSAKKHSGKSCKLKKKKSCKEEMSCCKDKKDCSDKKKNCEGSSCPLKEKKK